MASPDAPSPAQMSGAFLQAADARFCSANRSGAAANTAPLLHLTESKTGQTPAQMASRGGTPERADVTASGTSKKTQKNPVSDV